MIAAYAARVRGGMRVMLAAAGLLLALSGCSGSDVASQPSGSAVPAGPEDQWVVVTYDVVDGDPSMLQLLPTETRADAALQDAGAGHIDGNEVGQGTYDMFFVGADAERMWQIVEPVLEGAPVAWTRVELRERLDDPDPTVITG